MEDLEHSWQKGAINCHVTGILFIALFMIPAISIAEVIEKFHANQKSIALTFDACETKTPSYFDAMILDYLLKKKMPFTVFISGKFAARNKDTIRDLSKLDFVEIENHSLNHINHMEKLSDDEIVREVDDTFLYNITKKRTKYFRFPAGNYNKRSLKLVERKYKVVHWTFPSGDADRKIMPERLTQWVLSKAKPGSILIFHINRRGYSTGKALPDIVNELTQKGYVFVKLEDVIENTQEATNIETTEISPKEKSDKKRNKKMLQKLD